MSLTDEINLNYLLYNADRELLPLKIVTTYYLNNLKTESLLLF